jgi:molybdopterin molybdotransferase
MISIARALGIVLENTPLLPMEDVALVDTLGRVLAEDVTADHDIPPFARSAMDGFAVRADDARTLPAVLEVVGQVRAGQWPDRSLAAGEAIEIMTGAPLPPGADAVQQVENTKRLEGGRVEFLAPVEANQNVAARASEVRVGDQVLARGLRIDPATVAVLASVGKARVSVGERPTLSVLVTGDELVEVDEKPTQARIRNSNGYAILAQSKDAGAEAHSLGVVPDEAARIARKVSEGLVSDVLVLSGGGSEGVYDLVEEVLESFGVEILFDKVAIKPGAPLVFGKLSPESPKAKPGRRGTTLVFGLPGNPVSAQVTFDLFVRPALLKLQGASVLSRPRVSVELAASVRNRSGRKSYLPARVRFEEGRLVARPLRSAGSGDLVAHARANALVVVDAEREEAAPGETAEALLLGRFLEDDGAPD